MNRYRTSRSRTAQLVRATLHSGTHLEKKEIKFKIGAKLSLFLNIRFLANSTYNKVDVTELPSPLSLTP
jgi:hypothetical protein